MKKINVMINGLPGNVAKIMTAAALNDDRFNVVPFSLTGQEIAENTTQMDNITFELVKPDTRDEKIKEIKLQFTSFIAIDYTHPTAVNSNAQFYTKNKIPFVMGTTGGDREQLEKVVKDAYPGAEAENPQRIPDRSWLAYLYIKIQRWLSTV